MQEQRAGGIFINSAGLHCEFYFRTEVLLAYYSDFSKMSIDNLKMKLTTGDLLKSRMSLREDIDSHFRLLMKAGVENTEELSDALKTKKSIEAFAVKTGVPVDYLTLLRREINSWQPKPRKIKSFPLLDQKIKTALQNNGITTTVAIYDHILTPLGRKALSVKTGLTEKQIVLVARMTDLCRLQYVNETFATLLVEAGYTTIQSVANADPDELQKKVNAIYKKQLLSKCTIGLNDMRYLIRLAKAASSEIQW